jgi:rod shape-determining protein MreC
MPRDRALIIVIATAIALLLLALAGFVGPVREFVRMVLLPFVRVTSSIGSSVGSVLRVRQDAVAARDRAEELDARLRAITVDYVRLRGLEEENRSLRAQAKFLNTSGFESLGARVISRAILYETAAVTVDRGARDGVEVGQAVLTDEGLLVGKITTLGERTSVVLLLSDIRSRIAARVAGTDRLTGIVEGRGNGTARYTLIPQSIPVKRDDVVVTAGTEEKVPGNLAIGLVNDVQSQQTDPFKTAAVELLAPLDRLELVSIMIPRTSTEEAVSSSL